VKHPALLLGSTLLFAAGCGHTAVLRPATQPQVELIGDAYQPGQVRAAVVHALASRRFVAEGEEPGKIVARYERDGRQARIAVEYSQTQFVIRFLASANMSETKDGSGSVMVDSLYFDWTKALDRTIQDELKKIGKDAAAAAKADRDYAIMLEQAKNGGGNSGGDTAATVAGALAPALVQAVPQTSINVQSKTVVHK
jgi:hypothetical protein